MRFCNAVSRPIANPRAASMNAPSIGARMSLMSIWASISLNRELATWVNAIAYPDHAVTLCDGQEPVRISAECSVIGIAISPKAKAISPSG